MERQPGAHPRIVHPGLRVLVGHPNLSKTTETIPNSSEQTREFASDSRKIEITERGGRISVRARTSWRIEELSQTKQNYSESLRTTLVSRGIWHRFIEFDEPVRTVEEAARKVSADKIIKSIVLIGSDKKPILAILPARNKISYKKIKTLLKVKDVRLAQSDEVLEYSGYPVGGVPPFNKISRILLDPTVQQNARSIAGGGDPNKLVEFETRDRLECLDPIIVDFSV
jgi:prolyl-tRNA editing enzyme YbaK/EbsC (Cys-tRNA(Pro) deacylase)